MTQPEESLHRRIAGKVRELRAARGWSAARLADEMTAAGTRWDRSIVANFENGRRAYVTAEELVTLARVLGTSPLLLLLASDGNPVDQVAAVAGQLLRGPFHLEIDADTGGVTSWSLGGVPRVDRQISDDVFNAALRATREAGDGER